MAELSDADVFGSSPPAATSVPGEMSDADVFGAPQKPGVAESAVAPITDIPSTYSRMVNESVAQMGRGASQLASGDPWSMVKGAGNLGLGGLGYVTAPINAPLHTIVGEPVEHATGSPLAGSLAEAGAGFALPVPKGLPRMGRAAELPAESEFGVTLSGGEAANDLALRQKEQKAIRSGEAPEWVAQRQAQLGEANQNLIQGLDPFGQDIAESAGQAPGDLVSQAVQKSAASQKAAVRSAYDEAKALPGEIHAGVFEGMPQGIKGDLTLGDNPVIIDQGTTPNAAKMIDYLDKQVSNLKIQNKADPFGPPNPETVTGVNLSGIDQWRKNLSSMRRDAFSASMPAQTSADARASQAVLNNFDDRIDQAVNGGMFTGDKSAINAWNNARAANTDYQSTFGVRKGDPVSRVVQKIIGDKVNDPLTPGKVMDQIVGSVTNPSTLNIGVANRLKSILGEQSPEWIGAKQEVLRKIIEAGEGETPLGTGQVAQRLSKFLNSDMAGALYTPAEQATLRAYANLNRQITMPPGSYFPSAPPIQAAMAAMRARVGGIVGALIGHTLVPIPLVGELGGLAAGAQTERVLERLHSGVSKQLPIVGDQMAKWSRAQSAAMAQPTNPLLRQAAVGATVNLQKALSPLGIDMKQLAGAPPGPGTVNAEPQQQNVPGVIQEHHAGGAIDQQRATGGKVGGDSEHKGQVESKSADKSSTEKTLYVMRLLLNAGDVIAWAKRVGFKKTVVPADMHITIAFSRDKVDHHALKPERRPLVANGGKRAVKPLGEEGAVVLAFDSSELSARWKEFRDIGASWDWESYQPHVTITYDGEGMDLKGIKPYMGPLRFGPEKFSELDEDAKDKIKERASGGRVNKVQIDATHDGPWMSCMSIDGATMYRNRNIPATANIKGKTVDVDDMLLHHEVPEREDLEKLIAEFKKRFNREPNMKERKAIYLKAHNRYGTPNERAHAKKIGIDWKAWSAWCRGEEAKIEKMKFTNQPKDADVKPIPHSHDDLEAMDHASAA